jgi:hypothetical protein
MLLIIFPADDGKVAIEISNAVVIQETFFFQDLHHGSNTVVMGFRIGKMRDHFLNKCLTEIPVHLHDLFFSFCKLYHR